ncbi:MAG: diguanylate cyclase [Acidobacteria bacterium]|nr:diguanylate cyclase [Acidobacteriota bacterium]MCB9378035.1 diguanylate cyclase [Holophagales bacterium]
MRRTGGRARAGRLGWAAALVAAAFPLAGAAAGSVPLDGAWDVGEPARHVFVESRDLPHSTIHSLLVAQDGRLWAGTQDGAAYYDGTAWTTVDLPTRSSSNFVRAIAQTADGSLWFGTQSAGLARLRGGDWQVFREDAGLPDTRINILLARSGPAGEELWIGTHNGGLARFSGGRFESYGVESGLPSPRIWDLLALRGAMRSELWVATGAGVARWLDAEQRFEVPEGSPSESVSSLAGRIDSSGLSELWVGTYGDGILRLVRGRWEAVDLGDDPGLRFVTDLAPTLDEGSLWIASDGGGVLRWSEDREERLELGDTLTSGAVYRVLETRPEEGGRAVWLGSRNQGLIRVSRGYWRSFSPVAGAPRIAVTALAVEPTGAGREAIWLGTDGRGALRFSEGRWVRHDAASGALGNDNVLSFAVAPTASGGSEVWVGTRNGGLSHWDGARWKRYDARHGAIGNDLVQALLATRPSDGSPAALWVGTRGGLDRFEAGVWHHDIGGEGGPRGSVVALAEAPDGAGGRELWVGTTSGAFRGLPGKWRRYDEASGLRNPTVHALHVRTSASGRPSLWLGTDGGGAYRLWLDDAEARPEPVQELVDQRLASQVVYAFAEDAAGRLYFSTNRGIVRLTEAGERFTAELFESFHGLPSDQGNRGAATTDGKGRVWFGTVRGAAALDPALEVADRTRKRLLLTARDLYSGAGAFVDGARLPPGRGHVRFDFRLLSYFGEERTRYRTRLASFEAAFGDWTSSIEREYSSLPPGAYRFEVIGRDAAGNLSGPIGLAFEVAPAFWQTAWAKWGGALLIVALLAAAWRGRTAVHHRREEALQELVAARTRQLENANALLIDLSYLDPLTSIPNRRRFDEVLAEEWRRAGRSRSRLSLLMIDVDCFKAFNDTYGHQSGDDCLRQVAASLSDHLPRAGDSVARYGGEEFAVLLPGTDAAGAYLLAERLRQEVARLGIPHRASGVASHVTVSCGVASRRPHGDEDPATLVAGADVALYAAKRRGRDRSTLEE